MTRMPAVALVAAAGKRSRAIDIAKRAEELGFAGIYVPSLGDCLGFCTSLAHVTSTIPFGTAIQPIYPRKPRELASSAAHIHEVSNGRFTLGIGVSHAPMYSMLGVQDEVTTPLADTRRYVSEMRDSEKQVGALPPIVLATLRNKMLDLAVEIGDGAVWANASRSAIPAQVARIPKERIDAGFHVGNMIPTVTLPANATDEQRAAGWAVNRKTLTMYVNLPNYRNYWKQAGYETEMVAIEDAIAKGDRAALPSLMTDRWISDNTLCGTPDEIRTEVDAWFAAGISTPILVPSSINGGQLQAFDELLGVWS